MADVIPHFSWLIVTYALLGGILPALAWLWFWLKEDSAHPEPRRLIVLTFLAGSASVLLAFGLEKISVQFFGHFKALYYEPDFSLPTLKFVISEIPLFLAWAVIEEGLKYGAAYFAAFRRREFDEPLDAMIYLITAAIGFAAFENSLFLFNTLFGPEGPVLFLLTGNLRFLGATILHIVSSSVFGGILALSYCASRAKKITALIGGLLTASILHALFNFFIILNEGRDILKVFLLLWGAAVLVLLFFEKVKKVVCSPDFNKPN